MDNKSQRRLMALSMAVAGAGMMWWNIPIAQAGVIWDAGDGTDNINARKNWDGGSNGQLPDITGGTAVVEFGTGGSQATNNATTSFLGIKFTRDANFAIADGAGASMSIGASGIVADSSGTTARTYAITESIILTAAQTWQTNDPYSKLNVTGTVNNNGKLLTVNAYGNANGTVTIGNVISGNGGLSKTGNGTLILSAANTYTGDSRASAGTLELNNINALQNSTLDMNATDSGSISWTAGGTYVLGGLTGSRDLDLGGKTVQIGNNNISTVYSGTISNGLLVKVGTGTLALSSTGSLADNTAINLNGGTFDTSANTTFAIDSGQTFKGQGMFKTSSDVTTIIKGNLQVGQDNDTVARILNVTNGNTTLASTAKIYLDLFNGSADKIDATGKKLTLGGTINILKSGSFTFANGQSWDLFDGNISGSFDTVLPDVSAQHLTWNTSQLTTTGVLSLDAVASAVLSDTNPGGTITATTTTITGIDGKYALGNAHLSTAAEAGLIEIVSTNGIDNPTYVMLDLASGDAAAVAAALGGTTDRTLMSKYDYTGINYDVLLTFNQASAADAYFSFDLTGLASVQNVGVVPEPTGIALIIVPALGMLTRRRHVKRT